ncbi:hypothetical protein, conserved [Leishmania donovani]|uniref:CWF21 domain-containing protein n=1 Tax=Leishmania donovani TaxID=5661 RepID=A0A3S5H4T7_LEIDO|nr:hypothetical protein, conserved [Leishmania donovani]AYU75530.1 hypothetical protein LdCL_010006900 [Leishmania donovani]TPP54559.1 hypothetical protein CGC21_18005 [Leishmania donovani]CBZ31106.1 hypothetical protein, conserved [Leishmania donovani]
MYNGVEAAAVKGTGLSGYVQRSRVNVLATGRVPAEEGAAAMEGGASINPLEQRRAQGENREMAARLESHRALREVRLRVMLYREEREAAGVDPVTMDRECGELYDSLLVAAKRRLKAQQKTENAKTVAKFAAAFGVKATAAVTTSGGGAGSGSAFDRSVQEVEKHRTEEERRRHQEAQLVEHLKRMRREGSDAVEGANIWDTEETGI